jgi:hypothetical protein
MTHDPSSRRLGQLNDALAALLDKYGARPPGPWRISDGCEPPNPTGDGLALAPGWALTEADAPPPAVPLLPWRHERRFVELKRLVDEHTVWPLLMCRFAHHANGQETSLDAILYREFDLAEWLSGAALVGLCASLAEGRAANVIIRLAGGAIGSVEASVTLPPGAPTQDRHELIARRGVASDRAVDTQVAQSSVYVWTADGSQQHTDVDAELFGFDEEQAALARSAYDALRRPESVAALRERHRRLRRLVELAFESDRRQQRLAAEGGAA